MANVPLVSIIVPAYNNEDTIERSLLSLVSQRYERKEIIVVCDKGSSDNTLQAAETISRKFDFIRVISVEHTGRSRARNIGWRNGKGDIFLFADADDIYNEDYLDKAVNCLVSNPNFGGVTVTGTSMKLESTLVTNCIEVYSAIVRKMTAEGRLRPSWAWVYRHEAIEKVGGFDENLSQAEDKDLYTRVQQAGYSFGFVGGINWWHTRRGKLVSHMRKSYLAGKRRIAYTIKYREFREFFYSVIPFWVLLALFTLSLVSLLFLWAGLLMILVFMVYQLAFTLRFGWRVVPDKKYLLIYPFYGWATYVATSLGYTRGILLVSEEKLGITRIDWSMI